MRKNKDLFSIFPADAGVNLWLGLVVDAVENIPRGCGGEPTSKPELFSAPQYSPRMRG